MGLNALLLYDMYVAKELNVLYQRGNWKYRSESVIVYRWSSVVQSFK